MNNPTLDLLLNRRSIRQFSGQGVKADDLQTILKAAQQAPSSTNGQQISLIVTQDKNTIAKIAQLAGGQPQIATCEVFITFVIDFHRTQIACEMVGVEQVIQASAEGLMVGAVDAGIMLSSLQVAAQSLGYGTTAIGGIRNNPEAMIALLGLPENTFPIVGSTIGVPDKSHKQEVKPRVPLASFAMLEKYDAKAVKLGVEAYDVTLRQWWDKQNLSEMPTYSRAVANTYQQIYFPTIAKTLTKQGFAFKDAL